MSTNLTNIEFKLADGKVSNLKDFSGKVVLVVNVASECGLTPQYEGLEAIYEKYNAKGFSVLGFPANEFGAQEPGSNEEIQAFCRGTFGVKFPVAQKIVVKGKDIHPLYQALISAKPEAIEKKGGDLKDVLKKHNLLSGNANEIMWNFEKFLINQNGDVVARFAPDVEPTSAEVVGAIESLLK